jgi:hypothetical protein
MMTATLISLTRQPVNTPNPAIKAERVVLGEQGAVSKNPGFFYRFTKDANVDPAEVSKNGGF